MGYDVHITRKQNWFDEDNINVISFEEWKGIVNTDPDMRMDNYAEATTTKGTTIRVDSPGLSVWTKYSGNGKDGNYAWFDFREDQIVVKNPDDEIMRKMLEIALSLKAKVQGDEGEVYFRTADNKIIYTRNDPETTITAKKPWWKFW